MVKQHDLIKKKKESNFISFNISFIFHFVTHHLYFLFIFFFLCFGQFPVHAHHQKSTDNLGLNYVTERILASVLPQRNKSLHAVDQPINRPHSDTMSISPQDIYERELISMLEQKHGKVTGI